MPATSLSKKPQNSAQRFVDDVPVLGVSLLMVLLSCALLTIVSFIGGVLQLLEVPSVYSRLPVSVPTWGYFCGTVGLGLVTKLLGKCLPG